MNRHILLTLQAICACTILLLLSGCFKDNCKHSYKLYTPVYKTLTEVRANMKSGAPRSLENPGKLYVFGNYIFLNEDNKGIHIIDNSQPSAPKNIAFVNIPGNVDLSVSGSTLYADSYSDLVVFDISTPTQVTAKKFLNNVFPHRNSFYLGASSNPDSIKVIADWVSRDTVVECETYTYLYNNFYALSQADKSGSYASPGVGGMGGSMARFTIFNNHLYTVTNTNLKVFNISSRENPSFTNEVNIGWGIETIYPFKDKLFIGSNTGMFIYDVSNPGTPSKLGQFQHVFSCDPVIAEDKYAYVTLRSGTICRNATNLLEVINIENVLQPSAVKTYTMTNPHGLSKDGNILFLCDGKAGLKIYDASNVLNVKLIKTVDNLETFDVIAWNRRALVVAKDGLYQFDYTDQGNIKLLSKINIDK
jgi:hypothetical protein